MIGLNVASFIPGLDKINSKALVFTATSFGMPKDKAEKFTSKTEFGSSTASFIDNTFGSGKHDPQKLDLVGYAVQSIIAHNKNIQYFLLLNESLYFDNPLFNAITAFRVAVKTGVEKLKGLEYIPKNTQAAILVFCDYLINLFGFDLVMEFDLTKRSAIGSVHYPTSAKLGVIITSVLALALVSLFVYLKLRVND